MGLQLRAAGALATRGRVSMAPRYFVLEGPMPNDAPKRVGILRVGDLEGQFVICRGLAREERGAIGFQDSRRGYRVPRFLAFLGSGWDAGSKGPHGRQQ